MADFTQKMKSGKYIDPALMALKKRLNEILIIRSQHDELLRLMSPEDQKKLNVEATFKPFRSINSLYCSSKYSVDEWNNAKKQYTDNLQPIEGEIIAKLRKEIFSEKLSATQLLREFRRWTGLLNLAGIKKAFTSERIALLGNLLTEAKNIKNEFESRSGQKIEVIPGMTEPPENKWSSKKVSAIIWARELFGKIQTNLRMSQSLLIDLEQSHEYVELAKDLAQKVKEYETEQYNKWLEDIKLGMEDPENPLALDMAGKFMEINISTGLLEVKYSDRLAVLIREVRQLKELDFKPPKEVEKLAEDAKKYYQQAVTLKQIADFYNNMSTQIVPSQRPMVLQMAVEFENVVKSAETGKGKGKVSWSNTVELGKYIARVKGAAEGLMNENRKLKRIHEAVGDMVAELINVDMVKKRQKFREITERIKNTVATVSQNRDESEVRSWHIHWDYQLYKVMEYQYVKGLHSLSESLPTFNVEIVRG